MKESVMLVNSSGIGIGTMEKMAVHRKGALHRAFSVFIFNTSGNLLLQQRAWDKYHSGGQWSNTCCSHPKLGEKTLDAAGRRLMEEMGMQCEVEELFQFTYRHEFANGLIEHEYDHVFIGFSDQLPNPDPAEVIDFKYIDPGLLAAELAGQPEKYTAWLGICFEKVFTVINQNY